MVEPPEGIMLTRWLGGVTRWVVKTWHRLMKSSPSQDQLKKQENSFFFRIKIFDHNIFEIEYGRKHESSSVKTLPGLNVSKNIERQKEKSFKVQEASTRDKKTQKEFKDIAALEKAAQKGNAKAQFQLAVNYRLGKSVEKNLEEAFKWCAKAAKQGNADAQNNLGSMYYRGEGVEKDFEKAFCWWTKAAEQGNADAQNNLGSMYYRGEGVEKDPNEAIHWYTKAAEQGNAVAQLNLGVIFYFGQGVLENYEKAFQWYTKSAKQGNAYAQFNLGMMYYFGEGVLENYEKAFQWYAKAAEQGHVEALTNLGVLYYKGEGVEKNISIAYGLCLLAAQGNDEKAENVLLKIRPILTTEEITEGQKIAQEWQAKIDAKKKKEQ